MRYFMLIMGILMASVFLLAIVTGMACAGKATPAVAVPQPPDGAPLLCLALVGGPALLAGIVWSGTLRRIEI